MARRVTARTAPSVVLLVLLGARAVRTGGAFCVPCTQKIAPAFGPDTERARSAVGLRQGVRCARSALEDRPEDVAKIRAASRRVLGGLLQNAMENVGPDAPVRRESKVAPAGMKSAAPQDEAGAVLGFLGRAHMAMCVAKGVCDHGDPALTVVLTAHAHNAWQPPLKEEWPHRVSVVATDQEVVDAASVVCLALEPDELDMVMRGVSLRRDQTVLSVVPDTTIAHVAAASAPATDVVRVITTPQIAEGLGPFAMYPRNDKVAAIARGVAGAVLTVDEEDALKALASSTVLTAPLQALCDTVDAWVHAHGVDQVSSLNVAVALALFSRCSDTFVHAMGGEWRVEGCGSGCVRSLRTTSVWQTASSQFVAQMFAAVGTRSPGRHAQPSDSIQVCRSVEDDEGTYDRPGESSGGYTWTG